MSITLKGVTIGTVCAAISAVFMIIFHRSLPAEIVALLPVAVAAIAHYIGFNFAIKSAVIKEEGCIFPTTRKYRRFHRRLSIS